MDTSKVISRTQQYDLMNVCSWALCVPPSSWLPTTVSSTRQFLPFGRLFVPPPRLEVLAPAVCMAGMALTSILCGTRGTW
jgi:hypothetical protein